ncbi:uncharacterized protein LOC143240851 [Tachypleus tridentatus]|uniref:uncharacterized protein LOC143240851 n=1 Tax=Tachypleus tridentatus TaxID=6853 RepID=UPI003FD17CD2
MNSNVSQEMKFNPASSVLYKEQPTMFSPPLLKNDIGHFFPAKLAQGLGMAKILCGTMLTVLGSLAILLSANMADIGGGLWTGLIALTAGIFGVIAGKHPKKVVCLIVFMSISMLSIGATGVFIILTATGLTHDIHAPADIYTNSNGNPTSFLGNMTSRVPAIAMNAIMLFLAILDCLLSVACCVISAKEACQCNMSFSDPNFKGPDSQARRERLFIWLKQQAFVKKLEKTQLPKESFSENTDKSVPQDKGREFQKSPVFHESVSKHNSSKYNSQLSSIQHQHLNSSRHSLHPMQTLSSQLQENSKHFGEPYKVLKGFQVKTMIGDVDRRYVPVDRCFSVDVSKKPKEKWYHEDIQRTLSC